MDCLIRHADAGVMAGRMKSRNNIPELLISSPACRALHTAVIFSRILKVPGSQILIDEKIGGTMHIALGRSYPECGGTNKSPIHWDIVKDTRKDSSILMDGKLIFENGQFLI